MPLYPVIKRISPLQVFGSEVVACLGYLIQNPRKYPIHGLFCEPLPEVSLTVEKCGVSSCKG